jgi:hypothetical protein
MAYLVTSEWIEPMAPKRVGGRKTCRIIREDEGKVNRGERTARFVFVKKKSKFFGYLRRSNGI